MGGLSSRLKIGQIIVSLDSTSKSGFRISSKIFELALNAKIFHNISLGFVTKARGIVTVGMKYSTLQQYKEAMMLCEEGMIIVKARSALLVP
jgi:hypothetical protein